MVDWSPPDVTLRPSRISCYLSGSLYHFEKNNHFEISWCLDIIFPNSWKLEDKIWKIISRIENFLRESFLYDKKEREKSDKKLAIKFLIFQWCNYRVTGQFVHRFKQKRLDSYFKDVYSFVRWKVRSIRMNKSDETNNNYQIIKYVCLRNTIWNKNWIKISRRIFFSFVYHPLFFFFLEQESYSSILSRVDILQILFFRLFRYIFARNLFHS